MNRGEKWFSEKLLKILTSKIFGPSHSRYDYVPPVSRAPASELVLQRGSLASKIAFQGGNLESKFVYRRVVADFENRKIFSAHNDQSSMKHEQK